MSRGRPWSLLSAVLLLLALSSARSAAAAQQQVIALRVTGVINPVKAGLVQRGVQQAEQEHAEAVLVSLDTPGGLVTSMQDIVSALENSKVPVITFVAPRSAQASSAGAFILLSGDIAAMAPGTRVGAAHPVGSGGEELKGPINDKVTNSLTSLMRSLAERRGRPVDQAEAIVKESVSFTAEQAHEKHLVELLAQDEPSLLAAVDGRKVDGRTLHTRGALLVPVGLTAFERLLDHLADPTLASLLLSLGVLGLLYELSTPGIGAGGVVGAVLLVLGLLGSSVLPLDLAALALLVIGVVAIALEAHLPTHGVLAGAGVLSLVFGGLMLVDRADYFGAFQGVRGAVFVPVLLLAALGLLLLGRAARRALRAPPLTGPDALVGQRGTARSSFGVNVAPRSGVVFVDGARWPAESDDGEITNGEPVRVVSVLERPTRLLVRRET